MPKPILDHVNPDAFYIILQDPVSKEIAWVLYNDYIKTIKQETLKQRDRHVFFTSYSSSSEKIGSCQIDNGKADLYFRDGKLTAEVFLKNTEGKILCEEIEGLPKELLLKPDCIPDYLKNAQARFLQTCDDAYCKLYLSPKLLGGFNVPWWGWCIGGAVLLGGGIALCLSIEPALAAGSAGIALLYSSLGGIAEFSGVFAFINGLDMRNAPNETKNEDDELEKLTKMIEEELIFNTKLRERTKLLEEISKGENSEIMRLSGQNANRESKENLARQGDVMSDDSNDERINYGSNNQTRKITHRRHRST